MEIKKITNGTKIILSLDVNGPMTALNEVALRPYDGISERLSNLKKKGVKILLNSGWDTETLESIDRIYLNNVCDGFIGEHGRIFKLKNKKTIVVVPEIAEKEFIQIFRKNVEVCAKRGISFALPRNFANFLSYYDYETELRGYIDRKEIGLEDIHKSLKNAQLKDGKIILKNELDSYKALYKVMSKEVIMTSLKPKIYDDKLELALSKGRDGMKFEELGGIAEEIAGGNWLVNKINDDFCIDYTYAGFTEETHKGTGLYNAVSELMKDEKGELLIIGIGDSIGDLKMKEANGLPVIFFGLKGTSTEKDADFVSESGIEFLDYIYKMLKTDGQ